MTDKTGQLKLERGAYWMRWHGSHVEKEGWVCCWVDENLYGKMNDQSVYTPGSDNPYHLSGLKDLEYRRIEAPNG